MKRIKKIVRGLICLALVYIFFGALVTITIVDDNGKPVVYRSASTHEIVRVEIRGKIVPTSQAGKRHHNIWVQ